MKPIQEKLLYVLRDIHNSQKSDSSYFDPVKGGTNSDNFFAIDSDYRVIEQEATALEQLGYLKIMDRGTITKGLQITQSGIDWVLADIDAKRMVAEAQAIADQLLQSKTEAIDTIAQSTTEGIKWRAVSLILIDEINNLRQWLVSFKGQVALSSSLADLKTRVATLPNTPDRTLNQFKTAYTDKINNGHAD